MLTSRTQQRAPRYRGSAPTSYARRSTLHSGHTCWRRHPSGKRGSTFMFGATRSSTGTCAGTRSGRPGSLLTLAPHRSGRAGSAASGSSTDGFATRRRVPAGPGSQAMATAIPKACLASSAIRCRDVETGPNLGVLAVFPSTGATCRCPLPSTGSRGLNSPASILGRMGLDTLSSGFPVSGGRNRMRLGHPIEDLTPRTTSLPRMVRLMGRPLMRPLDSRN